MGVTNTKREKGVLEYKRTYSIYLASAIFSANLTTPCYAGGIQISVLKNFASSPNFLAPRR